MASILKDDLLRILILEDEPNDRDLLVYEFKKAGLAFTAEMVDNGPDFENALTHFDPTLILADYNLPAYHGVDAFYTAKKALPHVPFILVSGAIGEERAVELIRGGATDYVIKDKLFTLVPKMKRALAEAREHALIKKAEDELKLAGIHRDHAQRLAHIGWWVMDVSTGIGTWTEETCRIYGLEPHDNHHTYEAWLSFIYPADLTEVKTKADRHWATYSDFNCYHRIVRADGAVRFIYSEAHFEKDSTGKPVRIFGITQDVTERKETEARLHESEQSLQQLFDNTSDVIYSIDRNYRLVMFNKAFNENFYALFGHYPVMGDAAFDFMSKEQRQAMIARAEKAIKGEDYEHESEYYFNGKRYCFFNRIHPVVRNGEIAGLVFFGSDITERKLHEEKIKQSEARLARAQEVAHLGGWEMNIITGLSVLSDECCRIYGLDVSENIISVETYLSAIHPDDVQMMTDVVQHCVSTLQDVSVNHRIMHKDGTIRHVHTEAKHVFYPDGKHKVLHGTAHDITDLKLAEEKIKQSEARLARAQEVAHLGNWELDLDTGVAFWSDETCRICGLNAGENVQSLQNYIGFIHPEDAEFVKGEVERSIVEHTNSSFIHRILRKDGTIRYVHNQGAHQFDPAGKSHIMHGIVQDITERKQAEDKLRKSEARLKRAQELAHLGYWEMDPTTLTGFWSDENCKIYGLDPSDNLQSVYTFFAFVHPDDRDYVTDLVMKSIAKKTDRSFFHRIVRKDGKVRHVHSEARNEFDAEGRIKVIHGTTHDITETIEAENKLKETEQNLKDVFDNTADYICSFDREHRLVSFNKAFADNFRMLTKSDPAPGMVYSRSFDEDVNKSLALNFERALEGESFSVHEHFVFGGKSYWFSVRYSPIVRNGQVTGIAIFSNDITQRKNAEILLHKSFEDLQIASYRQSAILDTLPANITLLDKEGMIVKVNSSWRKFAFENGLKHSNACLGLNYIEIAESATGDDMITGKQMAEGIRNIISGKIEKFSLEYPCHSPEMQRWFKAEVRALDEYDELGAVIMHLEITDRNKAEEEVKMLNHDLEVRIAERTSQLEQANKEMEAFSYTVSHDLRSPLQVINGYAAIIEKKYNPVMNDDCRMLLKGIRDNTLHMSQLIADLLNFSHLGRYDLKRTPLCMNDLVKVVINELKQGNTELKHTFIINPLKGVSADPGLVHQVWVNLLANAVKYSSRNPNPVVEVGLKRINNEDVFYVKDNGAGFDMQHYHKLFTAFHRLHKSSEFEGTGVGLALVHQVISRHGGRIWAEAKVNEGATFYFTLPDVESN